MSLLAGVRGESRELPDEAPGHNDAGDASPIAGQEPQALFAGDESPGHTDDEAAPPSRSVTTRMTLGHYDGNAGDPRGDLDFQFDFQLAERERGGDGNTGFR